MYDIQEIREIELVDDDWFSVKEDPLGGFLSGSDGKTSAATVVAGSLLSFVDGLVKQETQDVLDSVEFATRVARAQFDRNLQSKDWYNEFLDALQNVGWTVEQFAFSRFEQDEGNLQMDKAALSIISEIATGNQLSVLSKSIDALKSLSEGDKPIDIFDYFSSSAAGANFQLGSVQKSENNVLSMAFGGFHFANKKRKRKFLFVSWGEEDVELWTGAQKMTLNIQSYSGVRTAIRDRLGESSKKFVVDVPLSDA